MEGFRNGNSERHFFGKLFSIVMWESYKNENSIGVKRGKTAGGRSFSTLAECSRCQDGSDKRPREFEVL